MPFEFRTRRRRLKATVLVVFGIIAMGIFSGCKTVKPWERGVLADDSMRNDRDPIANSMSEHIYYSREAAAGGHGVGGGGCGCN